MPKGGKREGAGRKPTGERKSLVERLSPYDDKVCSVIIKKAIAGEPAFVKMFMEYLHGKPDQFIQAAIETKEVQTFSIGGKEITF
jgi:hypothetical protein